MHLWGITINYIMKAIRRVFGKNNKTQNSYSRLHKVLSLNIRVVFKWTKQQRHSRANLLKPTLSGLAHDCGQVEANRKLVKRRDEQISNMLVLLDKLASHVAPERTCCRQVANLRVGPVGPHDLRRSVAKVLKSGLIWWKKTWRGLLCLGMKYDDHVMAHTRNVIKHVLEREHIVY